jgi:hypothetical protein
MKNLHPCPKCDSAKIIRIPGSSGAFGTGNNIPAGMTVFSSVCVSRYLCSNCGFIEEWVESPADIKKLSDYYG